METKEELLEKVRRNALEGRGASIDDCMTLAAAADESLGEAGEAWLNRLSDVANEVRKARVGNVMDTCSIVNGKSGRCTENCKWCAQAAAHHTGCAEYDFIDENEYNRAATLNNSQGVKRFSIVCSGRKVAMHDLRRYCALYEKTRKETNLFLCASMGLLNKEELQALYDAGVRRYHCNIETAASYFPSLCTTHTREDKLQTIGMGETLRQRLEMAEESREAGAISIPVNLLSPIKGTPLENTPLISEREVILTVALMRFIAPNSTLRFAGGRARLSREATVRLLNGGINGALVGDMLTTIGNNMDEDRKLFDENGFTM
jgi:biotin synthase